MDVKYVVASGLQEMTQTPGQLLSKALEERRISKTAFAEMMGVRYGTVLRWCEDRGGFKPATRKEAARKLQLPGSHFDAPTATEEHDQLCREALRGFLAETPATQISDDEINSISGFKPPISKRPLPVFYAGALNLVRGLPPSEAFAKELAENEALRRSLTRKLEKAGETEEELRQKGRRMPDKKGKRTKR